MLFHIFVLVNNFGILVICVIIIGDVLSGTSSSGVHHFGVLKGCFGQCWWTAHTFVLLLETLFVFASLGFFKRIGTYTTLYYYVITSSMLHIGLTGPESIVGFRPKETHGLQGLEHKAEMWAMEREGVNWDSSLPSLLHLV